jgi:hypothetical protein
VFAAIRSALSSDARSSLKQQLLDNKFDEVMKLPWQAQVFSRSFCWRQSGVVKLPIQQNFRCQQSEVKWNITA